MLLSIAYAPPIQYFTKILNGKVLLEGAESYIKQTYRNRTRLLSSNGILDLSIPLKKGANSGCFIRDVQISNHDNWRAKHWNAIQSCYGLAPFFEYYAYELEPFYKKDYKYLFDFDLEYLYKILDLLHIDFDIQITTTYQDIVKNDYRNLIIPKKNIKDLTFSPIPYYQGGLDNGSFVENLSILDLLFNMGGESKLILKKSINIERY